MNDVHVIVVSARTEDCEPVVPSDIRQCCDCGHDVWVSASLLEGTLRNDPVPDFLCIHCLTRRRWAG